jgi:hypothetical protein
VTSIATATRPHGGSESASIPCRSRSNFGGDRDEHTRRLRACATPSRLQRRRSSGRALKKSLSFTPASGVVKVTGFTDALDYTPAPKQRPRRKCAPLRQCNRASLLANLPGDEMPLLIEMIPGQMRNPVLSNLCRKHRAKPIPPKSNGLMADVDPALGPQILNVAQRQRLPHAHHQDQTDPFRRAVEISERVAHCLALAWPRHRERFV